jgi:hypothetical protein
MNQQVTIEEKGEVAALTQTINLMAGMLSAFGDEVSRTDPASLDEFLTRPASIRLRWPQYAEVFGLAAVNWLADCACLACANPRHRGADPLVRPGPGLRRRRRGRQHQGHAGRVRPGRGDLTAALVAADLTTARTLTG